MKKNSMLILIIIIASFMFSACTMSASTPPPVAPTSMDLSEIARQATERAIANTPKSGDTQAPEATSETEVAATATPENVAAATNTPEPEETEDPGIVTEYAVPDTYTLQQGEFPFCLARRFNILPEDILDYNGIESGTIFYPGKTISLPPSGRTYIGNRALQYHPATYSVVYGDTLYSIACLYGDVDPRAIAAANDLDIDQVLTPGILLQIP
jgi:LysM repeat protein